MTIGGGTELIAWRMADFEKKGKHPEPFFRYSLGRFFTSVLRFDENNCGEESFALVIAQERRVRILQVFK